MRLGLVAGVVIDLAAGVSAGVGRGYRYSVTDCWQIGRTIILLAVKTYLSRPHVLVCSILLPVFLSCSCLLASVVLASLTPYLDFVSDHPHLLIIAFASSGLSDIIFGAALMKHGNCADNSTSNEGGEMKAL